MGDLMCSTCLTVFKTKQNIENHIKKKRKCHPPDEIVVQNVCECGKRFMHRSGLCRHRKTCEGPKKTLEEKVEELQEKVRILESAVTTTSPPTVNNNQVNGDVNQNNNNTNSNNVTIINNFGRENLDYLDALGFADLKKTLKLTPDHDSVINMLNFIHHNAEHPENHTIRMDDVDDDTVSIHKRGKWRPAERDKTFFELIGQQCLRFMDLERKISHGLSKSKYKELADYLARAVAMAEAEDTAQYPDDAFDDLMRRAKDSTVAATT